MKIILIITLVLAVCSVSVLSQSIQDVTQRYSYHVWGSVLDEQSQPMANISVCFIWVNGPLKGRLPCTKTDFEGNFALTVKGIPDKYIVSASTKGNSLILDEDLQMGNRVKYSEQMEFGAKDECRKVRLQFDVKD